MDQDEPLAKARKFAEMAFGVDLDKISRETEGKIVSARAKASANRDLFSGNLVAEMARINGERITLLVKARLVRKLEGFELHGVTLSDGMVEDLIKELGSLRSGCVSGVARSYAHDAVLSRGVVPESVYFQAVEQNVGMHPNEIRTEIERWRLMPKKAQTTTSVTIYSVQGSNNNRWLTNSQDHSVNVVVQSSDQIFSNLRQTIRAGVRDDDRQKQILEKLTALEQAQNSASFKERYAEFISTAADYVTLISPFIPALTEMLQKAF